jgi:hypothetical protein
MSEVNTKAVSGMETNANKETLANNTLLPLEATCGRFIDHHHP